LEKEENYQELQLLNELPSFCISTERRNLIGSENRRINPAISMCDSNFVASEKLFLLAGIKTFSFIPTLIIE